ncbi:MAG: hypothetical protein FGM46_03945 [Ferruginibacter sp.]|nr:hypothetical protein [Ferruginibacter sp.]
MEIKLIFFAAQCFSIMLSFIFSLRIINNHKIPKYLEGFYWYNIVAFFFALLSFVETFITGIKISPFLLNFSLLFHFIFLGSFIIKTMPTSSLTKWLKVAFVIFTVLLLAYILSDNFFKINNKAYSISNFSLTIICLFYYFQLFRKPPILSLKEMPSFWIVSGVFFGMGINTPFSAIVDFFKNKPMIINHVFFYVLMTNGYIIMHLFFIKGFLCSSKVKKI